MALACLLALTAACASQPPVQSGGQVAETEQGQAAGTEAEASSKPDCRYRATTSSRLGNRDCS